MPITEEIKEVIAKNDKNIISLDLSGASMSDNDVKELQRLLQTNSYISSIDLSDNTITDDACEILAQLKIEKINLKGNYLGDDGVLMLLTSLTIRELNISSNGLTDKSAKQILACINKYKSLEIDNNPRISYQLINEIRNHFLDNSVNFEEPIGIDLGLNIGYKPFG